MIKVLSVVGARPNFMKVAPIHRAFLKYQDQVEHYIVHTGQHYDHKMSESFFQDLDMPQPAYFLGVGSGSHAEQTAKVMVEFEKVCLDLKPDFVIVVGDVNSTIACALTAVKLGIRVAHVEGGLRSFDREMPEEINRIATDSICDYCFITEESGMVNLRKSGFSEDSIYFVGNTMIDSLYYALPKALKSDILTNLGLKSKEYVLMTLHRPSNVDDKEQLEDLLKIFVELSTNRKVVFPVHPRTNKNIDNHNLRNIIEGNKNIILIDPLGYIDFLALMNSADFIMTDSGGIQEETTVLGVPCLTLRTTTERPSTIDLGTNILIQPHPSNIRTAIDDMLNKPRKKGQIPPLWDGKASDRTAEIITELLSRSPIVN